MSTISTSLTTWEEFLQLPDEPEGTRRELWDGEVVLVPPARPFHVYIQHLLAEWLRSAAAGKGSAEVEFPYRPAANLQYWFADVAYLAHEDWDAMRSEDYPVYAPPLVIEVLSPSNKPEKIQRQRIAAFSAGTREFWVVDAERETVEVSVPGQPSRVYGVGEHVPVAVLPDAAPLAVEKLFRK